MFKRLWLIVIFIFQVLFLSYGFSGTSCQDYLVNLTVLNSEPEVGRVVITNAFRKKQQTNIINNKAAFEKRIAQLLQELEVLSINIKNFHKFISNVSLSLKMNAPYRKHEVNFMELYFWLDSYMNFYRQYSTILKIPMPEDIFNLNKVTKVDEKMSGIKSYLEMIAEGIKNYIDKYNELNPHKLFEYYPRILIDDKKTFLQSTKIEKDEFLDLPFQGDYFKKRALLQFEYLLPEMIILIEKSIPELQVNFQQKVEVLQKLHPEGLIAEEKKSLAAITIRALIYDVNKTYEKLSLFMYYYKDVVLLEEVSETQKQKLISFYESVNTEIIPGLKNALVYAIEASGYLPMARDLPNLLGQSLLNINKFELEIMNSIKITNDNKNIIK